MDSDKSTQPRPRANEKKCDFAIKKTLAYSSIFKYPLSFYQLSTFLLSKKSYDYDFFTKAVRRVVKKKHVRAKEGKFYHPSCKPVSWVIRKKYTKDLLDESQFGFKMLKAIPWIKLLAVTGSVAAYNATKDDDIDLFVITEKNRVWLTRGFVILILKAINKYAQNGETNRKFCCNLYIDESNLKWPQDKQSMYIAREIITMHPVINRDNTYFAFMKENMWLKEYFCNFHITFAEVTQTKKVEKSRLINRLEKTAKDLQMRYMKKKKTTEITRKDFIHFNKNDHTERVISEFRTLLKDL